MSQCKQPTAGPWMWITRHDGSVELVTPDRGHLIVMDFMRKGMQKGQPRFATWEGEVRGRFGGIMVPADKLDIFTHPDARLIVASPDMLTALEAALPILSTYIHPDQFDGHAARALVMVRDALAKAKEGLTP